MDAVEKETGLTSAPAPDADGKDEYVEIESLEPDDDDDGDDVALDTGTAKGRHGVQDGDDSSEGNRTNDTDASEGNQTSGLLVNEALLAETVPGAGTNLMQAEAEKQVQSGIAEPTNKEDEGDDAGDDDNDEEAMLSNEVLGENTGESRERSTTILMATDVPVDEAVIKHSRQTSDATMLDMEDGTQGDGIGASNNGNDDDEDDDADDFEREEEKDGDDGLDNDAGDELDRSQDDGMYLNASVTIEDVAASLSENRDGSEETGDEAGSGDGQAPAVKRVAERVSSGMLAKDERRSRHGSLSSATNVVGVAEVASGLQQTDQSSGSGSDLANSEDIDELDARLEAQLSWPLTKEAAIVFARRKNSNYATTDATVVNYGAPGIAIEGIQEDPLEELAKRSGVTALRRRSTSVTEASSQEEMALLTQLLEEGSWNLALRVTSNILMRHGQGVGISGQPTESLFTLSTMRVWYLRSIIMCRLHLYTTLDKELKSFGSLDRPDLYFEYYRRDRRGIEGASGSMVPFGLRIVHAELPQYLPDGAGSVTESINRLFSLLNACNLMVKHYKGQLEDGQQKASKAPGSTQSSPTSATAESNAAHKAATTGASVPSPASGLQKTSAERNVVRTKYNVWCARRRQVWTSLGNAFLRIQDYRMAMRLFHNVARIETLNIDLHCTMGRIALMIGDLHLANKRFSKAYELSKTPNDKAKVHVNYALLDVAKGEFSMGLKRLKNLLASSTETSAETHGHAINNQGVLGLYAREELAVVVGQLEKEMEEHAPISEVALRNLVSLYELQTKHHNTKKAGWLPHLLEQSHDGFDISALKLK